MADDTTATVTWDIYRRWFKNKGAPGCVWHYKEADVTIRFSELEDRFFEILVDGQVVGRSDGDDIGKAKNLALALFQTRSGGAG